MVCYYYDYFKYLIIVIFRLLDTFNDIGLFMNSPTFREKRKRHVWILFKNLKTSFMSLGSETGV